MWAIGDNSPEFHRLYRNADNLAPRNDRVRRWAKAFTNRSMRSHRCESTDVQSEPVADEWPKVHLFLFRSSGAPLAPKQNCWTTFGMCFLPIILILLPAVFVSADQAKFGRPYPPLRGVAGNVVLSGFGADL